MIHTSCTTMFCKTILMEQGQLYPNNKLTYPFTNIQWTEWNLAAAEGSICVGERQKGKQRGFVGKIGPIRRCPGQLCKPLMGCLLSLCAMSQSVSVHERRFWERRAGRPRWWWLVKVPLLWGGLRQRQRVQNSRTDHKDDTKFWMIQSYGFNYTQLTRSFFNDATHSNLCLMHKQARILHTVF